MPRLLLPASTLRWTSWLGAIFGGVAMALGAGWLLPEILKNEMDVGIAIGAAGLGVFVALQKTSTRHQRNTVLGGMGLAAVVGALAQGLATGEWHLAWWTGAVNAGACLLLLGFLREHELAAARALGWMGVDIALHGANLQNALLHIPGRDRVDAVCQEIETRLVSHAAQPVSVMEFVGMCQRAKTAWAPRYNSDVQELEAATTQPTLDQQIQALGAFDPERGLRVEAAARREQLMTRATRQSEPYSIPPRKL